MDDNIKRFIKDAAYDFTVNTAYYLFKGSRRRRSTGGSKAKRPISKMIADSVVLPDKGKKETDDA